MGNADRSVLDDAWAHVRQSHAVSQTRGSFTRTRIERVIQLLVGPGSLVLGAQAFVAAFAPGDELPDWRLPLLIAVFGTLIAMVVACIWGRFARTLAGVFAVVYVVALVLWPFATGGSVPSATEEPWIFYLINVATVAAVVAFPLSLQIAWAVGTPLLFGLVRLIQGGFGEEYWFTVGLDVSFALILGGVLVTLGWMYRSVASNVDITRAEAVASYADAAAIAATERERVSVAALMHDSVLGALLAAERAETSRERTLAVTMAREALTRLANAEKDPWEGSDEPVEAIALGDEIESASAELGVPITVERDVEIGAPRVPGRVARALVLAAMQAVANSVQHAGAEGLAVRLRGTADPGIVRVRVRDTGPGFDLASIPEDRLGIRGSILARVTAVGGRTEIESNSHGTTVTLEWESGDRW